MVPPATIAAWHEPGTAAGSLQPMNQLAIIAAAAQSYGIPFLLAGGHAVIAHGFARSTFDIDLIARQTDRESWLRVARSAGYEFLRRHGTDEFYERVRRACGTN